MSSSRLPVIRCIVAMVISCNNRLPERLDERGQGSLRQHPCLNLYRGVPGRPTLRAPIRRCGG